jgi:ribosomal protein S18 acetylase RimI-like enzyme
MDLSNTTLQIVEADLGNDNHAATIVELLDTYARDRFGGSKPLSESTRERLIPAMRQHPTSLVLLTFDNQTAVGMATCFIGFSTFQAQPLLNIHDLVVVPSHRGRGIGRALLGAAEQAAIKRGCCKLTLEVVDDNLLARGLYESYGFVNYELGESKVTRFLQKPIRHPSE